MADEVRRQAQSRDSLSGLAQNSCFDGLTLLGRSRFSKEIALHAGPPKRPWLRRIQLQVHPAESRACSPRSRELKAARLTRLHPAHLAHPDWRVSRSHARKSSLIPKEMGSARDRASHMLDGSERASLHRLIPATNSILLPRVHDFTVYMTEPDFSPMAPI
jgi:hypothetical protein